LPRRLEHQGLLHAALSTETISEDLVGKNKSRSKEGE
jgi:hypothetical protein